MNITVILCTYNRCASLAAALESAAACIVPHAASWQVLVVDNNSTDQTPQVVAGFIERHPGRFRYLFEPKPGKSHALNSGIREASGDVLAFMDDDVAVDSHWLENLTAVLRNPEWAGAGGRILPERSFTLPDWLLIDNRYALAPLAIFDLGSEAGELHESPFGTNMAFRRQVFEKVGDFRTDLGPRPGSEARNEDTEFGDRVLAAGFRLWYEPRAIVYHSLPVHRLQRRYFLTWWHDKARADIRQDGVPANMRWFIAGVPLSMFRRLCVWTLRWMITFDPGRRFSRKLSAYRAAGAIRECYSQWRTKSLAGSSAAQAPAPTSSGIRK